jgi:hypothetical protein
MSKEVLDRLLITLAVRLHAFALCEIKQGWRLVFDPMEAVVIHYVLAGAGTLRVSGSEPVSFSARHMMIVPPGLAQALEAGPADYEAKADISSKVAGDGLVTFTPATAVATSWWSAGRFRRVTPALSACSIR